MTATTKRTLSDKQIADFERDGFLAVRNFLAKEEVDEIRNCFMAVNAEGPVPGLSEIGAHYRPEDPLSFYPRMMHPHRHPELPVGPLAMKYMLNAKVGETLNDLFGEEAVAVQSMFYFKPPGARGQELHQDNYYLRVKPGTCMAAWLAVDDADEENGGMMVVPGSHDQDISCPEKADPAVSFTGDYVQVPEGREKTPCNLKAGDMLFFNGSVIHGSTPNLSPDRFRRAFICHYVPISTAEMSHHYKPKFDFAGRDIDMPDNPDGGPCGVMDVGVH